MSYLDAVTRGKKAVPRRTLIYGSHGVGKTNRAAKWSNPVLLPTEDGFHHIDVASGPLIKTSAGLKQAIRDVRESDFETIILDSIDWAEKICSEELDASSFDQSWGKGAVELGHRIASILRELELCRDAGKHIVLVGHEQITKVVRPDGKEYGTRSVKLSKHSSRVVCEWCDEVLYAECDYLVKSSDGKFGGVAVDKGTRSLYTANSPLHEAKNRIVDLPERFELSDFETYFSYVKGE